MSFEYDSKGKKRTDILRWDISEMTHLKFEQKAKNNPSFYNVFNPKRNMTRAIKKDFKYYSTGERNIITEITGKTGCLSNDTMIKGHGRTNRGFKSIKKNIIKTKSYNFYSQRLVDSVSFMIPSGEKEVFELKTSNSVVKASKDHKFFILESGEVVERELKDLKVGDKLVKFKK